MRTFNLGDIATAVLVLCALTMTGLLVRREFVRPASGRPLGNLGVQKDWEQYANSEDTIGVRGAPVTIVEFGDYECPACRVLHNHLDSLQSLGVAFQVVYRHFPLKIHRFAIPAARASRCAADQGRFEGMHKALYEHADSLGLVSWWWYARTAGVGDSMAFEVCLRSAEAGRALARDTLDGQRLGITGTPTTILIGSLRVNGVPPFDSLRAYIARAGQADS